MKKIKGKLGSIFFAALLFPVGVSAQSLNFQEAQSPQTGSAPGGMVVEDFDGDSFLDLAVANTQDNFISIFRGNGNGTFTFVQNIPSGASFAITSGDFNHDGNIDLATAGVVSDITILFGNGNGTFSPGESYFIPGAGLGGISFRSIKADDLNNDNHPDLLAVGFTQYSAVILLNEGDGTFSQPEYLIASLTNAAKPVSLSGLSASEIADFNEDGHSDLAILNRDESRVFLFFGSGSGTFPTSTHISVGSSPRALSRGDINQDGHQDLVVSGSVVGNPTVLLGNGNGGFVSKVSSNIGTDEFSHVLADFDGDGNLDIAAPFSFGKRVDIGLGDGAGFFTKNSEISTGGNPVHIVSGDFNGDTLPDLVVSLGQYNQMVMIYLNSVNHAPVLEPIGNKSVLEGEHLTFTLLASDQDGDTLSYSATNLPPGATFDQATATFSWTPTYEQSGNYVDVEFTVVDDGIPMQLAFEDITISVGQVNRPPIFNFIGSQEVLEHDTLTFTVSAIDPDGDSLSLTAQNLPVGASFDPLNGLFSWTPGYPTAGVYIPTFVAIDDGAPQVASSSIDVVITVGSNPTPTEQSESLIEAVVADDLLTNQENAYLANLAKVATFIEQGKIQAAINQLEAFLQKVNQDYAQGQITEVQRDAFILQAEALIMVLST